MSAADFDVYLEQSIQKYAQEKVRAGNWTAEEGLQRSRESFQELLPQGTETPDNYVYSVVDSETNEKVGMLWVAVVTREAQRFAFIYDFEIFAPFRRRGYALQALHAVEDKVATLGLERLSLHVFGHNHAARALYAKAGYEITNISMTKPIQPRG